MMSYVVRAFLGDALFVYRWLLIALSSCLLLFGRGCDMRLEKKVTDYTLKFCDRELKVIMECLKGAKLEDCRDQCWAWDLLDEFKELLGENEDEVNEEEYLDKSYTESIVNQEDCVNQQIINQQRQQMINSIMRKPSEESKLRAKARIDKAQGLLRKLRGN